MTTTTVDDLSPETAPGVVYDRYLAEGVLAYQRCADFDHVVFPPRVLCPTCGCGALQWHASAGAGAVYAVTTLHPRGGGDYNVSLVDLDEGFRMMTNVIGIDPADVRIGMRVRATIDTTADEPLPLFVRDDVTGDDR